MASEWVKMEGDCCRLAGEIDFTTAPALLHTVAAEIRPGRDLVIDFADVTQANSVGLALLLEWNHQASEAGGSVNHKNLPESLQQLSEICQVSSFI